MNDAIVVVNGRSRSIRFEVPARSDTFERILCWTKKTAKSLGAESIELWHEGIVWKWRSI
jgi:hypothetical protein